MAEEAAATKANHAPARKPPPRQMDTKSRQDGGGGVPLVFPLHVNHFKRRTSNGTPLPVLRPDTPLYHSPPANTDTDILAPKPRKAIKILENSQAQQSQPPSILPPMPPPPDIIPPPSSHTATVPVPVPAFSQRRNSSNSPHNPPRRRHPPDAFSTASHLHGTRSRCVRHGRKPRRPEPSTSIRDFEKACRSGAYLPTGMTVRRQVEVTSPWAFPPTTKMMRDGGVAKPAFFFADSHLAPLRPDDVHASCPDCVAELGYKRREAMQTVIRPPITDAQAVRVAAPTVSVGFPAPKSSERVVGPSPPLIASPDLTPSLLPSPLNLSARVVDVRANPRPYHHAPPVPRAVKGVRWPGWKSGAVGVVVNSLGKG
ncbi:hypothetical protein M433DRAFT_160894 [Acidomyces richmondensis BFW]|nr:MAG: hypothetical protein FE78DRAFT_89508 [Acidomyces sp. 'richmondensis']KYG40113.1 hypothetical protein M433DRAFT_160894 [Acidomyces richmondensis BFW]